MINDMSLKAKIRNIAKERNISAQSVLQIYLMNRFLYRLSKTEYKDKYIVKGGILISSIVGIDQRATMDIDTSLRNQKLTKENICKMFDAVCAIETDDGIKFVFGNLSPIRADDSYGGYRLTYHACFGKINAPMSMDISTGDVITPDASKRIFYDIFDNDCEYELLSYTLETILAEKVETILSRGVENTRPRDFYDIYTLSSFAYDKDIFKEAFKATAKHRDSLDKISNYNVILNAIENDSVMQKRWQDYVKITPYAKGIEFKDTIDKIKTVLDQ